MRTAALIALLGILIPATPSGTAAQTAGEGATGASAPLFTSGDALWLGGFAAGALLLAPLDVAIAKAVRDSALQKNPWVSRPAGALRLLGIPGSVLATGGMYAAGRLADRPALADAGLHAGGAIVLATAVTLGTKMLAGRARPYADPDDPLDFGLGRGFRDDAYQSLPSGHATAAFAAAAAITAEVGHHWPDAELAAGTALFGTAALVGVSRLYHNVHWASDAAVGAGVGTLLGWNVVQYMHANPDNQIDRWMLGMTLSPGAAAGTASLWIAPAP